MYLLGLKSKMILKGFPKISSSFRFQFSTPCRILFIYKHNTDGNCIQTNKYILVYVMYIYIKRTGIELYEFNDTNQTFDRAHLFLLLFFSLRYLQSSQFGEY